MKDGAGDRWHHRRQRAAALAAALPFAAEGLRFYECVAGVQRSLYATVAAGLGDEQVARPPGSLREELDLFLLLPAFPGFLAVVEAAAPPPLSRAVAELSGQGAARWQAVLHDYWRLEPAAAAGLTPAESLVAWTFLQPYAEYLADHSEALVIDGTPNTCPRCSGRPLAGVLRPLGDGGKRSLVCALCATEWDYRRIVCPACGEEGVDKLPVYTAEEPGQLRHVRVEACDTCRHYLKTIDMTKDGRAVPVVDELAAIPLSLWAEEHGYSKVQINLLGL